MLKEDKFLCSALTEIRRRNLDAYCLDMLHILSESHNCTVELTASASNRMMGKSSHLSATLNKCVSLLGKFSVKLPRIHSVCMLMMIKHSTSLIGEITVLSNGRVVRQVVAGGNGPGNRYDQLNNPTDMTLDKRTDSLIICDRDNGRVIRWPRRGSTNGETIISDVYRKGLTMDDEGFLYVSDQDEVRRWRVGETSGTVVAGGNGLGSSLNQLNAPTHIFVDGDQSVYVSDWNNDRVTKWKKGAKEGIVVVGDQGRGDALTQLDEVQGVFVDQFGTVYVADEDNHRIMRWPQGATKGSAIVDGNGYGYEANQFRHPFGLSFDGKNNLYVVDELNCRVQRFSMK